MSISYILKKDGWNYKEIVAICTRTTELQNKITFQMPRGQFHSLYSNYVVCITLNFPPKQGH